MRRFWRRLVLQFTRDDLSIRVAALLAGAVVTCFGILLAFLILKQGLAAEAFPLAVVIWAFAALLIAWGLLLMSRCVVSAQSRIARIAEKAFPDGSGEEGILLIVFYLLLSLPVVLITLALRWCGLRGQRRVQ